jgi:hypothetical protein
MVDGRVQGLWIAGKTDLDKESKAIILGVLTETVILGGEKGPLQVSLARFASSLVRVLAGSERKLEIPVSV